jgi:hypothetical protein
LVWGYWFTGFLTDSRQEGQTMRFLRAAALAMSVMAVSVTPSRAAVVLLGDLGPEPSTIIGFNIPKAAGSFDYAYQLELLNKDGFSATVTNTVASAPISSFELQLWFGSIGGVLVDSAGGAGTPQSATVSVSSSLLGDYFIEFSGSNPATKKGFVVGGPVDTNVAVVSTPPVPEPATWALMGIGFACLGFLAYRRRGNQAGLRFA